MQAITFTYCLHVPAALGQDNSPWRMPLCSFLLFLHVALSCSALSQIPQKLDFHPPWHHSTPQGKHIKAVSRTCTSPFTKRSPCPLTHPASPQQQLHHMHVSFQYEMEKPAAKATAVTADLGISRKGSGED